MTQIEQYIERRKAELERDTLIHPANKAGRIKELDLLLASVEQSEKVLPFSEDFSLKNGAYTHIVRVASSADIDKLIRSSRQISEQSENNGKLEASPELEKEIDSYWNKTTGFQPPFAVAELKKQDLAEVARHFAEWQRQKDEQKCHGCFDRDEVFRRGMLKGAKEKLAEVMQAAGFKPPYKDGDQYCTLFGIDLMRSFVGFGNTETESFIEALKDVKNFIEK